MNLVEMNILIVISMSSKYSLQTYIEEKMVDGF